MNDIEIAIKNKIHNIRGKQVMLDSDLAELYVVETSRLNEQVKRNIERFPEDFHFQLTENELFELRNYWVSQNAIPNSKKMSLRIKPRAFTEQGVSMLSGILRSSKAVEVNIKIMRAFVEMRHFFVKNVDIFHKFQFMDHKFLEYDENFKELFKALNQNQLTHKQGIFFDGQVCDAYLFLSKLVRKAQREIILIDNYLDESILELFTKAKEIVKVKIFTKNSLNLDISKVQMQYANISINKFDKSHDRFLIIDSDLYHFGASLKDLGKKWFAFSKLDINPEVLLSTIPAVHFERSEAE